MSPYWSNFGTMGTYLCEGTHILHSCVDNDFTDSAEISFPKSILNKASASILVLPVLHQILKLYIANCTTH